MLKGKFIILYGINNLGKSTQAKLLVDKLNSEGRKAKYIKYPIYDLKPTGPKINDYLRGGNPEKLSAKDAQMLYVENREDYEPKLIEDLENGIDIVAEDYWGTGVAWGVGAGVDKDFLLELNKSFLKEDLALLLVGKRFETGIERNHKHETNEEFIERVDEIHRELGAEFGWKVLNANDTVEEVSIEIWKEVKKIL